MDCDKPLRAVCRNGCDHVEFWRCDSYGCRFCGELKRRRLSRLVDGGAGIHLANGMRGYFLTLTAPGTKLGHRRWVQGKRGGRRPPVCGCEAHGFSDGLWNGQESACWNRLRTALTRRREVIFAGAVEVQDGKRRADGVGREMLHRHVLLFVDDVLTFDEVQPLAIAAGYGCVVDVQPLRSQESAARYLSKYVTKSARGRADVAWERLDLVTGEVVGKRATYRLWSSSRKWGVTMREIKSAQSAQARQRAMYLRELEFATAQDQGAPVVASAGSDPPS